MASQSSLERAAEDQFHDLEDSIVAELGSAPVHVRGLQLVPDPGVQVGHLG